MNLANTLLVTLPDTLPMPGLLLGEYPQRRVPLNGALARSNARLRRWLDAAADQFSPWRGQRDAAWAAAVQTQVQTLASSNTSLQVHAANLRLQLRRDGLNHRHLTAGLALAACAAQQALGLQPFGVQLLAARAVLHGRLAEMATGEGKTLAVGLAAAVAALAGTPVHVLTANDYLVQRDAAQLEPLYRALGLSAGAVVQGDAPPKRAAAYGCAITYVTAKELVFDYLRDGLAAASGLRVLRGLCMAIIDEADALLIDEACVPLILSAPVPQAQSQALAEQAMALARLLREREHYELEPGVLRVALRPRGREHLAAQPACATGLWRHPAHREQATVQALTALHLLQRGQHYLVNEGRVQLIDATTGRVAEGRAWSQGLQQLVELKEGCELTPALDAVAQITYQRFFPRYHRLGGLSGTLREARAELLASYGLSVQRVALRKPCRRHVARSRLFEHAPGLWAAVARRCVAFQPSGRPVLVATDSVADTEALGQALRAVGLQPQVLHAGAPEQEAQVVARAGQRGALTLTTNMAGRGTDIVLGEGVAALGGLHLLACQLNGAARIDRQLAGRAARQGDPGSVETWLSLDNRLLAHGLPAAWLPALRRLAPHLPHAVVRALAAAVQWREQRTQRELRKRLAAQDERAAQQFAFCSGAQRQHMNER